MLTKCFMLTVIKFGFNVPVFSSMKTKRIKAYYLFVQVFMSSTVDPYKLNNQSVRFNSINHSIRYSLGHISFKVFSTANHVDFLKKYSTASLSVVDWVEINTPNRFLIARISKITKLMHHWMCYFFLCSPDLERFSFYVEKQEKI